MFPAIKDSLETSPASALPCSSDTVNRDSALSRGTWLSVLPITLHKVVLDCGLIKDEVALGVQPELPIDGAHFNLGNSLAGSKMSNDASPQPLVTSHSSGVPE